METSTSVDKTVDDLLFFLRLSRTHLYLKQNVKFKRNTGVGIYWVNFVKLNVIVTPLFSEQSRNL
jgi:hypothetical protein